MNNSFLVAYSILSILSATTVYSQSFQTDERVWDLSTQRAFSDLGRMRTSKPSLSDVKGSEYFETSFKDGTIENLDKKAYLKTQMRYNAFHDEIELIIINNGKKTVNALIKDKKIIPHFNKNRYYYVEYKRSKQKLNRGYLISIYKGNVIELFLRKRKKFLKGRVAKNSLDVSHPPKYVDDIEFYIRNNSDIPTYIKNSKKNIIDYFNKSKELKEFIRSENLNLDNSESIIRLIKFYEGSVANWY